MNEENKIPRCMSSRQDKTLCLTAPLTIIFCACYHRIHTQRKREKNAFLKISVTHRFHLPLLMGNEITESVYRLFLLFDIHRSMLFSIILVEFQERDILTHYILVHIQYVLKFNKIMFWFQYGLLLLSF